MFRFLISCLHQFWTLKTCRPDFFDCLNSIMVHTNIKFHDDINGAHCRTDSNYVLSIFLATHTCYFAKYFEFVGTGGTWDLTVQDPTVRGSICIETSTCDASCPWLAESILMCCFPKCVVSSMRSDEVAGSLIIFAPPQRESCNLHLNDDPN